MHLSTSFKYMCSAMTVLAYQSAAQLTTDTWIITYQDDAAVDFTTTSTDEITMTYEIGTGKVPTAALYDGDCTDLAAGGPGVAIDVVDLATTNVATIDTLEDAAGGVSTTLDHLTLKIGIDKTKIDGSNIWDTGTSKLAFCVELTLVDSGSGEVVTQE